MAAVSSGVESLKTRGTDKTRSVGRTHRRGDALGQRAGPARPHERLGLLPFFVAHRFVAAGVFGRVTGYEDVNDAERLRHGPAMRWIIVGKAAHGRAASPWVASKRAGSRWKRIYQHSLIFLPTDRFSPWSSSTVLPDPLFACATLVVERDDPLGGAAHVGDDESDAQNKLAGVPLDLSDHPAQLGPASRLIAEVGVVPPNIVRRATDWALVHIEHDALRPWSTHAVL